MADIEDQQGARNAKNSSNANSNSIHMSDASVSAAIAHTHPLQDVNLNQDHDVVDYMREVPLQNNNSSFESNSRSKSVTPTSKENWVKFDDDVNETEPPNENKTNNNNVTKSSNDNHKNNNNAVSKGISSVDSENAPRATTTATAPAATTISAAYNTVNVAATSLEGKNKLSSILPPPPQQHQTRSRTPTESKQQHQEIKAATPEQRNIASSTSTGTTGETTSKVADVAPAVLSTESTHVNLNSSGRRPQQHHQPPHHHQQQLQNHQKTIKPNNSYASNSQHQQNSNNGKPTNAISKSTTSSVAIPVESAPQMRTIELSTGRIREGFANGDVIVTLLPANTKWPWITPAIFRPELVPEELMAQGLTLTVEEYVHAMETLVNDYRFNVYNICYKRILVCWIFFAFAVLLTLLFSGLQGVALFSLGVGWLFLNAAAIFLCMWVKLRLSRGLEKCLARVNRQLMKHKILLVLDDRGRISCHKVNLCFLYFDATQCVNFLNDFLDHTEQNGGEAIKAGWEAKLDIDLNDIVIQGSNPVRLSRKQAVAQELFLSYLQRWGKDFLRRRLDWTVQEAGVHETPRHLQSSICPCQYEEEVLRNKIKMHLQSKQCCGINCLGCWL